MATGLGYYVVHVPDAVRAKAFYNTVLGWHPEPGADPQGYYHIEGSQPAGGINGGAESPRIATYFLVGDAKEAVSRIRELGGQAPDPSQSESGWSVECLDDQGGRFAIWQPAPSYAPDGPPKAKHGDLHYSVLPTADDERAKRFYGELFGWRFSEGSHPHGWNIEGVEPAAGMFGGGPDGRISVYFWVDDIEAAVARVDAAGGASGPVQTNRTGWHADCRDDQGTEFSLSSLRVG
jgi:predicted enzyme related to lactoylglutathione lyase